MSRASVITRLFCVRVLLASLSATAGCTLALPYPDAAPERGARCDNGIDDDLDALTDCADPSCDGSSMCTETTPALCADGRDNDGDERRDQEDIGCWRFVRSVVTRCESIGPATFAGSLRGLDDGWTGEGATIAIDPTDPARDEARAEPETGERIVLTGPAMAGALDGARFRARIFVGPRSRTFVGLLVAGADLRSDEPDGLFVAVYDGEVRVAGSDQYIRLADLGADEPRWVDVGMRLDRIDDGPEAFTIEIDGDVHEGVRLPRGFGARTAGRIPSAMVTGRPLRPLWVVDASAGLGASSATLARSDPCGYAVPQIATTVRGLVRGPDALCALTQGRAAGAGVGPVPAAAWASRDDGGIFARAGDLPSMAGLVAGGSSVLTIDGRYEGVMAMTRPNDVSIVALLGLSGARCGELDAESLELVVPTAVFAFSPAYDVVSRDGALVRRITFARGADSNVTGAVSSNITEASSQSGAPGTFALERDQMFPARYYHELFGGLQILRAGSDRAVVFATDRGIDAVVETAPGEWLLGDQPLLTPSGAVGTFDQLLVSSPTVLLDPPAPRTEAPRQTGLIAFTGATTCPAGPGCELPSGILEFELLPPSE